MKKFLWLPALLLACVATAQQSPAEFLGYEPGTQRLTPHYRVLDYFRYLQQQFPGQLKLVQYGSTYENRPLMLAVLASAQHFPKIEEIRTNHLKAAGLLDGQPSGASLPIAWMNYNIHGNENVSSEAAMIVAYRLLKNQPTDLLKNTVVLIEPCSNPDGYERYVNGFTQRVGRVPNPSPNAWEHTEPWPGGRMNHYFFDLNRDWAWLVQRESQARNAIYQQWMPHVFADYHEQGINSPYFFAPPAKPMHADVTAWQREFQTLMGEANRRLFDQKGWLYFTRENFDLFYPSYGDTYPTFNGAVGMTFEQAGNGRAGLAIVKADGDTLTLKDRIEHHVETSLATIGALGANSERAMKEFSSFFKNAALNTSHPVKTYVVKTRDEPAKIRAFTNYLDKMGFQYGYAGKTLALREAFSYQTDKTGSLTTEPGDLVIPLGQPRATFLKILMEPRTALEDSVTYDITSWALPYAYGLNAFAVREKLTPEAAPAATAVSAPAPARPYAYLLRWNAPADVRTWGRLLQEKIKGRVATRPFELEGQQYGPGTVIITRGENTRLGDRFDAVMKQIADTEKASLVPVSTGYVSTGPDLGSNYAGQLASPKVALVVGPGASPYAAGEVWHFFDEELRYPLTLVSTDDFVQTDLNDYNVLIFANGNYARLLSEAGLNRMKEWIRGGGKLILMERAVAAVAGKEGFSLKKADEDKKDEKASAADLKAYGDRERTAVSGETPGAVYRITLDPTHPLAFGMPRAYYGLVLATSSYPYLKDGWNVGYLKNTGPVSGFVGGSARSKLQNTLMYGVEEMGRGQVVYLINNPLFRGFWYQGKLLFANAVFMVGQ